jgi:hypothetical protein
LISPPGLWVAVPEIAAVLDEIKPKRNGGADLVMAAIDLHVQRFEAAQHERTKYYH